MSISSTSLAASIFVAWAETVIKENPRNNWNPLTWILAFGLEGAPCRVAFNNILADGVFSHFLATPVATLPEHELFERWNQAKHPLWVEIHPSTICIVNGEEPTIEYEISMPPYFLELQNWKI